MTGSIMMKRRKMVMIIILMMMRMMMRRSIKRRRSNPLKTYPYLLKILFALVRFRRRDLRRGRESDVLRKASENRDFLIIRCLLRDLLRPSRGERDYVFGTDLAVLEAVVGETEVHRGYVV